VTEGFVIVICAMIILLALFLSLKWTNHGLTFDPMILMSGILVAVIIFVFARYRSYRVG